MTFYQERYRTESIRIPEREYQYGSYFVTICTHDRVTWFGDVIDGQMFHRTPGLIVMDEWARTPIVRPDVRLGAFVVMPDHFHGIIHLNREARDIHDQHGRVETPWHGVSTTRYRMRQIMNRNPRHKPEWRSGVLGAVIGQCKIVCTKRIRAAGYPDFRWQSRFYETIIRHDEMLQGVRTYIINNPMKWHEDKNMDPCRRHGMAALHTKHHTITPQCA